jgi:hypothetical protein
MEKGTMVRFHSPQATFVPFSYTYPIYFFDLRIFNNRGILRLELLYHFLGVFFEIIFVCVAEGNRIYAYGKSLFLAHGRFGV